MHKSETNEHICASDIDVFVLALSVMQHPGDNTTLITGSGSNRRYIPIMPTYHALGQNRINTLISFHTLIGCNITGRIFGKSKSAWWNAFNTASENVIKGLTELRAG